MGRHSLKTVGPEQGIRALLDAGHALLKLRFLSVDDLLYGAKMPSAELMKVGSKLRE